MGKCAEIKVLRAVLHMRIGDFSPIKTENGSMPSFELPIAV
jgi:hypothetical protein